jgi:hypothetical protein
MIKQDMDKQNVTEQNVTAQNADVQNSDTQNLDAQNLDAQNSDAQNLDAQNLDAQNLDAQNMDAQNMDAQNIDAQNADDVDAQDLNPQTFFGHSASPQMSSGPVPHQVLQPVLTRPALVRCVEPTPTLNVQDAFGMMNEDEKYVTVQFFKRILQAGVLVHVKKADRMLRDIYDQAGVQVDGSFEEYMQKVSIPIIGIRRSNNILVQDADG